MGENGLHILRYYKKWKRGTLTGKAKEKGKKNEVWLIQMLSITLFCVKIKIKYSTLYEFSYNFEFATLDIILV